MNKKTLLVIFFVTMLIIDEVNSIRWGSLFKRVWKSKLARKLRSKGKSLLKDYANRVLSGGPEEEAAPPAERKR
uniref:Antimicrobial bradykinin-potentiating peptide NDBP6 n=1 Tax=Mesobuthus gibbosus TaxID=123226 RepID=A0A059UD58_MESGB|nr:antimicrobial bradykinin-potentiating peptide NDBP6 [Mesobuthus gibbosus]